MRSRPIHFTIPIIIVIALFVAPIVRSAEEPELHKKIYELEDRQARLAKFFGEIKEQLLKYKKEFEDMKINIEEIFKAKH